MTQRLSKYRKQFLEEWFAFSNPMLFVIICFTYVALLFLKRIFIIDEIAAFEILNERGDIWMFDIIYNIQYLSIPVFLSWKWLWTSLVLWIGCFMFGYRIHFNRLWKLIMLLEIFFFVPEILKIVWFSVFTTDPDYFDYLAFYPLSVGSLFDHAQIAPQWMYPSKALNFFELIYAGLLGLGLYFIGGKRLRICFYIVLSSYVLFFLIWLGFYGVVY